MMAAMILVYLDMCSLKRPFDDQSQGRVAIETEAVLRILDKVRKGTLRMCGSEILTYENAGNPDPVRRERVHKILAAVTPGAPPVSARMRRRANTLAAQGIGGLDALHIAAAESQGADFFVTCDDPLIKKAAKIRPGITVVNPVSFMWEVGL